MWKSRGPRSMSNNAVYDQQGKDAKMQNGNHDTPQEMTLKVSIEEANLILEGLGQLPFARVYTLINKMQAQAGQQINAAGTNGAAQDAVEEQLAPKV